MSKAEELLNSLSEEVPVHSHPVPDTDTYFIIDPITRKIENTNRKKTVIMQYDHNSERFTFELPRYVDGHDMLECTSVTVNVDNIEMVTSDDAVPLVNSDAPDMTDLRLHPNDPEKVISSWLISRNSTQLAGSLSFHIEYKCVDSAGNVVYEWSTDTYDEIEVRARKKNGEAAVIEHTDLLEQWRTRIFSAGDSVMADIAAEGNTQVAAVKAESETQQEAVELKGAQTLDSIPEDYTEVDAMADEAVRSKGDAIVCEATGESIIIKDSSNDHIRGLKMFGKTTQVTTTGAQLANLPDGEIELGGVVWTCSGGVVTAVGTCNAESSSTGNSIYHDLTGLSGTFYVSGNSEPARVYIRVRENGSEKWYNNTSFTLTGTEESVLFYIQVANVGTVVNTTLYPMLNRGDTALPWEPYSGGKPSPNPEWSQEIKSIRPTVNVLTSNLLDVSSLDRRACTSLNVSDDGYIISLTGGTFGAYVSARYTISEDIVSGIRGKKVTFKMDSIESTQPDAFPGPQITLYEGLNPIMYYTLTANALETSFIVPETISKIELGAYVNNVGRALETDNVVTIKGVTMHIGEHNWEPYSVQYLSTKDALPGIRVTSGGNYIDSDGQQWICDEIDLERGVYVQRIKIDTVTISSQGVLDNGLKAGIYKARDKVPQLSVGAICDRAKYVGMSGSAKKPNCVYENVNTFGFTGTETDTLEALQAAYNGATIAYILATPIETPLTAEEITAFKALRTNYPNTTILNDAGAWMSVKYNADTKTYVENPKALKLVDSSTGVVYELKIVNGNITVKPI